MYCRGYKKQIQQLELELREARATAAATRAELSAECQARQAADATLAGMSGDLE